jgi:hyperosmotically inducible periplasmic protein
MLVADLVSLDRFAHFSYSAASHALTSMGLHTGYFDIAIKFSFVHSHDRIKELSMSMQSPRGLISVIVLSSALAAASGCSTSRTVGAYVDDTVITTQVKAKFAESKDVDATTIGVETINGTVLLRGVAKSPQAKAQAETIARGVDGVKAVNNRIDVHS